MLNKQCLAAPDALTVAVTAAKSAMSRVTGQVGRMHGRKKP